MKMGTNFKKAIFDSDIQYKPVLLVGLRRRREGGQALMAMGKFSWEEANQLKESSSQS